MQSKDTAPAAAAAKKMALSDFISKHFPQQLTDPEKKKRKSFSQFGYNLYLIPIPLFPITQFINPREYGIQSYGQPGKGERNGVLYTCKGGFIDFSHMRVAVDWTVYLTFKIITENGDFNLPDEGGNLKLHFKNLEKLSIEDIASMAEKIAFERLLWHEVASWHYHPPNYTLSEQQSAFSPEDIYSNSLGAYIGRKVALHILEDKDDRPYAEIASEAIKNEIELLDPVNSKKKSKEAYDIVDGYKQDQLLYSQRNDDIWWNSQIIFADERYVFKRYMNIGPLMDPWLVPSQEKIGCDSGTVAETIKLPQVTERGISFYKYYNFRIEPSAKLFYNKRTHKQIHPPFKPFSTENFATVVNQIRGEMEKALLPGFDKRDCTDPVPQYKGALKVMFR